MLDEMEREILAKEYYINPFKAIRYLRTLIFRIRALEKLIDQLIELFERADPMALKNGFEWMGLDEEMMKGRKSLGALKIELEKLRRKP